VEEKRGTWSTDPPGPTEKKHRWPTAGKIKAAKGSSMKKGKKKNPKKKRSKYLHPERWAGVQKGKDKRVCVERKRGLGCLEKSFNFQGALRFTITGHYPVALVERKKVLPGQGWEKKGSTRQEPASKLLKRTRTNAGLVCAEKKKSMKHPQKREEKIGLRDVKQPEPGQS